MTRTKGLLCIIVLVAIILTGCSTPGQQSGSLPNVMLVTGGASVEGDLLDFCFDGACTEAAPPSYTNATFHLLPANGSIDLDFQATIPTNVTLGLLEFRNGIVAFDRPVASITLTPQTNTANWQPNVDPGLYVVDAFIEWGDDFAVYWFPVEIP